MKLTVLTILILMLMAGLAMIQMDANTENQIQVLRETEMLTTQGLGPCEQVLSHTDQPRDPCGDKECHYRGTVQIEADSQTHTLHVYGIQWAIAYNQCGGYHPNKDCVHKIRNNQLQWQLCALVEVYLDQFCEGVLWDYEAEETQDFENIQGCPNSGGGGGGTFVGTSS